MITQMENINYLKLIFMKMEKLNLLGNIFQQGTEK